MGELLQRGAVVTQLVHQGGASGANDDVTFSHLYTHRGVIGLLNVLLDGNRFSRLVELPITQEVRYAIHASIVQDGRVVWLVSKNHRQTTLVFYKYEGILNG